MSGFYRCKNASIWMFLAASVVLCCLQIVGIYDFGRKNEPDAITSFLVPHSASFDYLSTTSSQTINVKGSATKIKQRKQPHPHVMFYHIFVPNVVLLGKDEENAFIHLIEKLVHEQLNQTNEYLSANDEISVGKINYLLVDSSPGSLFSEIRIQNICSRFKHLECKMMENQTEGNEYMTLTKLQEYCRATKDKSQRVSYFHSKGSFHPNRYNEVWRHHLLKGILHPDCLHPPTPEPDQIFSGAKKTCNVCGLQFYPVWNTFFPGNFWTAQCSMIEQLLDPDIYEKELRAIIPKMYNSKQFEANIYSWDLWSLGFGRMAAEFWVGSHPDLEPCDLSEVHDVFSWCRSIDNSPNLSFATGVRHGNNAIRHMIKRLVLPTVIKNETLRKKEYNWLNGLLFRWYALYGKFPPNDSWVWKYYPDGDYWHTRVQEPSYLNEFYADIQKQSSFVPEWNETLTETVVHDKGFNVYWIRDILHYLGKPSSPIDVSRIVKAHQRRQQQG